MAAFLEDGARQDERDGILAYSDSKRMQAISRYIKVNGTITDDDLNWFMSFMDRTFPNGSTYSYSQSFYVNFYLMRVKTFTSQQKEAIYQKCSRVLSEQESGTRLNNAEATETCCHLFGQINDQRAVPLLQPLQQSTNGRVKTVSARALTKLGHPVKINIANGGFGKLPSK